MEIDRARLHDAASIGRHRSTHCVIRHDTGMGKTLAIDKNVVANGNSLAAGCRNGLDQRRDTTVAGAVAKIAPPASLANGGRIGWADKDQVAVTRVPIQRDDPPETQWLTGRQVNPQTRQAEADDHAES